MIEKISDSKEITRKEAIKKIGKYSIITAASTMFILNPKTAQAGSSSPAPLR